MAATSSSVTLCPKSCLIEYIRCCSLKPVGNMARVSGCSSVVFRKLEIVPQPVSVDLKHSTTVKGVRMNVTLLGEQAQRARYSVTRTANDSTIRLTFNFCLVLSSLCYTSLKDRLYTRFAFKFFFF